MQTATTVAPGEWTDYVQVAVSNHLTTERLFVGAEVRYEGCLDDAHRTDPERTFSLE